MKAEDLEAEKKRLIETLGVYFEREKQVAPVAARILATIVLNGRKGTTFEQLVSELEASKSTICTHLNNLEGQRWISYFTRTGDRKRYYSMRPGYILHRISTLITQWNTEIDLQKQVIAFKTNFNSIYPEDKYPVAAHQEVLKFLETSVAYFEKQTIEFQTKNKLNNIEEL